MKDRLHGEISAELEQTTKTDKTTVVVAILLNVVFMLANMAFAAGAWSTRYDYRPDGSYTTSTEMNFSLLAAFLILLGVTIVFDVMVVRALSKGAERRVKLTEGLVKMYQEEGLDKYYDPEIVRGYQSRYALYKNIVLILGVLAVAIPVVFLGV
ncbi:hypothetical protein [Dehalogenimonas alkenigignens]|uniref:hypothetical protein n=1 Tax=Dehalogenimonas alkenigignens TaxID=1217799 RepID=UPI000D57BE4E|nr:hypothetical protein [Dehalogenimonas alkenigignens]PVV82761.1 hypothetical protein DD509_08210 [Dehalogenimonas alkenigignens]